MNEIKINMFVRCSIDNESIENPREFALGKVIDLNEFSKECIINFYDVNNIRVYYPNIPISLKISTSELRRCKIRIGAIVEYQQKKYIVKEFEENPNNDGYYYYYIASQTNDDIILVSENLLIASFNDDEYSPINQLIGYEFQNPVWFFGRSIVSKTNQIIENSMYGFKILAGCKIFLKPHQMSTIMRCLQEEKCRYMLADEVGLGKTIEALSVLKILISYRHNLNVLIVVPDALVEQWKTELCFKFKLFEGNNINDNNITLLPVSRLMSIETYRYNFLIVDEVHNLISNSMFYYKILSLSKSCEDILMLSATPIQQRKDEYYKLLKLIQPHKYECISKEDVFNLLNIQRKINRYIYDIFCSLDDYIEIIEESENQHNDDTEEIFEEIMDSFGKIIDIVIIDDKLSKLIQSIDYNSNDFGIEKIKVALSILCETYQLEKSIIRNRKNLEDINERQLVDIKYSIEEENNSFEFLTYRELSNFLESLDYSVEDFNKYYKPLIYSFFSSSRAFITQLKYIENVEISIPNTLKENALNWKFYEDMCINDIQSILEENFEDNQCRLVNIINYIDQEAFDKKILLFTDFSETFELYKEALIKYFGINSCCFFKNGMSSDELELNVYRFQTDKNYKIMLSDKTGGEGRNFQIANAVIHIDIPLNINDLEQRIGRLDRIGRKKNQPVISVVAYSYADNYHSIEEDLFNIWNDGINIFKLSQNGLEIIMNDIDNMIINGISSNFKYGLSNILNDIKNSVNENKQTIKEERSFDIARYKYSNINKQVERTIRLYSNNETQLFSNSMMSWAKLTGFHADIISNNVVRFTKTSFSTKSAQNTLFVPPNMKKIIENKTNILQNHIRELNGEKVTTQNNDYIQGTFDRNLAISNDYLHFFAPNDEIFDSIIDNAIHSYKGRCCAFSYDAYFNWLGLIFIWKINPNETLLLQNHISSLRINKYRGFLSGEQIITVFPISNPNNLDDSTVIREFENIVNVDNINDIKLLVEHLGKRTTINNDIRRKYGISNIEWFMKKYPYDIWKNMVLDGYKHCKSTAIKKFSKKSNIVGLKEELYTLKSSKIADSFYNNSLMQIENLEDITEIILKAFKTPKIILDAVCYGRFLK